MSDVLEQATEIRRQARALREQLSPADLQRLDRQEALDLWTAAKRAANALYSVAKDLDPQLLAEVGSEAKVLDSTGWPVEIKRRWEIELLDEDEFAAWCADRQVTPFETTVRVSKDAREAVRDALLEDGEVVPGVSAGFGAPFLSLGRGR